MTPTEADGGSSPPSDADLRALTDDQRRLEAARARRREHWLRRQAAEEGTFAGVLTDLAERDVPVAVLTAEGRTVLGTVRSLGTDFVGLRAPGGELVLVPLDRVATVRAEPTAAATVGDRGEPRGTTLEVVLADLAADRPTVAAHTLGGHHVAGELVGAAGDLLVLRAASGALTYARVGALDTLTVPWPLSR